MSGPDKTFGGLLSALIAAFGLGCLLWIAIEVIGELKAEAIQRGYALHCPQTGGFAWEGECDE